MPTLVGLIFLKLGPIFASLGLSFTNIRLARRGQWVGLANYRALFRAREFGTIMRNTTVYAVGTTVLVVTLSLGLALLANRKLRGVSLFRSAYFLPYVMPIVPVALAWTWLLQPQFGLINYFLSTFLHIKGPTWLHSYTWALPSLIIVAVWQGLGYYCILFTAGLMTIPQELYEVATIDGAGPWARFWHITLPLISPTTFFVTIMAVISSFHVFGSIYIMTDGGPGISTLVLSYAVYQEAFGFSKMGYASAMAWLLFCIVFVLTVIQIGLQRLWVFQGY
jgi:ABC-type sugar transport system permease subunit